MILCWQCQKYVHKERRAMCDNCFKTFSCCKFSIGILDYLKKDNFNRIKKFIERNADQDLKHFFSCHAIELYNLYSKIIFLK